MDQSHEKKLSQESSKNLINYLKLIKDLDKTTPEEPPKEEELPQDDFSDLSDEELKKLAAKAKHGGENE